MPRLSIERRLERQLAESSEAQRFTDMSAVVRRLHLGSANVPEKTVLLDERGGEWKAGEVTADGYLPVSSVVVGYSRKAKVGDRLHWSGGSVELCADTVLHMGGVWDHLAQRFRTGEDGQRDRGKGALVIDAMESQLSALAWLVERIEAFRDKRPHPQAAGLLYDDRRGGKSFVALLGVVLSCLECPHIDGSPIECRVVTQTIGARDELDEVFAFLNLKGLGWANFSELPKRMWRFVTGAKIRFLTTDNSDTTLEGRMDIVFLNEAALFTRNVYEQIIRATQDRRGFGVLATNKPKKPRGNWVSLMWQGAQRDEAEGNIPAVACLRVNPRDNASVNQEAKGPIARSILYARGGEDDDIDEGTIAEAGVKLFSPPWDEALHCLPLPELGLVDITEEYTRTAYGKGFPFIVGHDYQYQCAGSAWRLFAPGGDPQLVQMWCMWARWLNEDGDENDLLDEMEASGFNSQNCLVIPDCSGGSQGGQHKHGVEPPSFDRLRHRGYHLQEPTEKRGAQSKHAKNPPVATSLMRCRKWIADGRVFVAKTQDAAKMSRAFLRCDAYQDKFGDLRAKGSWAHLIDTFRYPQWWVQRWQLEFARVASSPRATRLSINLR